MNAANPLLDDSLVDFLLYDVFDVEQLCQRPYFSEHDRTTFDLYMQAARRVGREALFPTYRAVDEQPATLKDGRVSLHPAVHEQWPKVRDLGVIAAARPFAVGGAQLPQTVALLAGSYLAAGNLATAGFAGLTAGAAHLIESFGSDAVKALYLEPLLSGRFTGTMALTEPQAGSGLADLICRARPGGDDPGPGGHFFIKGAKTFISAGDHDLTENIIHLVLARLDGAPDGIRGISLFAVPKLRAETETGQERADDEDGAIHAHDNDVVVSGLIHKIGWRGIPSLALEFGGDRDDCRGYLVGEVGRGLACMFQMMNDARLMIGMNGVATASVAYHAACAYAQERYQGRALTERDPSTPTIPIAEHADVRRMLLRQKAIVTGGLTLTAHCAHYADRLQSAVHDDEKERCQLLLDLLTPVAKTFPAEFGFESNTLALQVFGGYGYSSEYLPEAWLRDQKLNSIHEGTTGIQGLDLLGRKVVAAGGRPLQILREEMQVTMASVRQNSVTELKPLATTLAEAADEVGASTAVLAERGINGDIEGMLRHSHTYLELFSVVVVGWELLRVASIASAKAQKSGRDLDRHFAAGLVRAARYWFVTEVARSKALSALLQSGEDSFAGFSPEHF